MAGVCRGGPLPREELVAEKKRELVAELETAGVEVQRDVTTRLLQYYPPFAPRWLRLQDVLLPVVQVLLQESCSNLLE